MFVLSIGNAKQLKLNVMTSTIQVKPFNYEIYVCDEHGNGGWDIHHVTVFADSKDEARKKLKDYPRFDCVIAFNYGGGKMDAEDIEAYATGADFYIPHRQF